MDSKFWAVISNKAIEGKEIKRFVLNKVQTQISRTGVVKDGVFGL